MKPVYIALGILAAISILLYKNQPNFKLPQATNFQPVIGIFTQPSEDAEYGYPGDKFSYISASYVKFLEAGGAQVVPILYNYNTTVLDSLFTGLNGIFFAGGSTNIMGPSNYSKAAGYMIQKALDANKNGDFFPIFGTCLGHQLVHYVLSGYNNSLLINVTGEEDITRSVEVVDSNALIFQQMSSDVYYAFTHYNLSYYHHVHGVSPSSYQDNPSIAQYLKITGVNQMFNSTDYYVASSQGIDYPIFTQQFHPEKPSYEFKVNANHTDLSIQAAQAFSDVFIDAARRSTHSFDTNTLNNVSINNYQPVFTIPTRYMQTYYFPTEWN